MTTGLVNKLPIKFTQNVIDLCGDEGKEWLNSLPRIINELENLWGINVENHFSNLSYNYVASCVDKNNTPNVLKIALP